MAGADKGPPWEPSRTCTWWCTESGPGELAGSASEVWPSRALGIQPSVPGKASKVGALADSPAGGADRVGLWNQAESRVGSPGQLGKIVQGVRPRRPRGLPPELYVARLDGDRFAIDGTQRLLSSRCRVESGSRVSTPPKLSPVSGLTCIVRGLDRPCPMALRRCHNRHLGRGYPVDRPVDIAVDNFVDYSYRPHR